MMCDVCSKGEVVEVIDRKAGWRSFSSLKRESLESDIKSKLRSISVKAGHRLVLTCPTYAPPSLHCYHRRL